MATRDLQNIWDTDGNADTKPAIVASGGKYPALDGSDITNIDADNVVGVSDDVQNAITASGASNKGAVYFNEVDSVADLGNIFNQDMTSDWSCSFWFKSEPSTSLDYIIGTHDSGTGWYSRINADGTLSVIISDGVNGASLTTTGVYDDDQWHFVGISVDVDSATGLTLYVDGEAIGTSDPTSVGDITTVSNLFAGGRDASTDGFIGAVSDVGFFATLLGSSDITELYTIGLGGFLAKYPELKWGGDGQPDPLNFTPSDRRFDSFTRNSSTSFDASSTASSSSDFASLGEVEVSVGQKVVVTHDSSAATDDGTINVFQLSLRESIDDIALKSDTVAISTGGGLTTTTLTATTAGTFVIALQISCNGSAGSGTMSVSTDSIGIERVGATAAYTFDEGIGYQAHDLSGLYDGVLSEDGFEWTIPDYDAFIRIQDVDLTVTSFLIGDRDTIADGSYITGIAKDGIWIDLSDSNTQDLTKLELRWDNGNTLQRSDGTTHDDVQFCPAGTVSSDITIYTKKG